MDWFECILFLVIIVLVISIAYRMFSPFLPSVMREFLGGGSKKFTLFTQDPWFAEMKAGRKTVEARVGPADRFKDLIGEKIVIKAGAEKINATVKEVKYYDDLKTYIKEEKWKKVAPHVGSEQEAIDAYLAITNKAGAHVYSDENIKAAGKVIAIKFELE